MLYLLSFLCTWGGRISRTMGARRQQTLRTSDWTMIEARNSGEHIILTFPTDSPHSFSFLPRTSRDRRVSTHKPRGRTERGPDPDSDRSSLARSLGSATPIDPAISNWGLEANKTLWNVGLLPLELGVTDLPGRFRWNTLFYNWMILSRPFGWGQLWSFLNQHHR